MLPVMLCVTRCFDCKQWTWNDSINPRAETKHIIQRLCPFKGFPVDMRRIKEEISPAGTQHLYGACASECLFWPRVCMWVCDALEQSILNGWAPGCDSLPWVTRMSMVPRAISALQIHRARRTWPSSGMRAQLSSGMRKNCLSILTLVKSRLYLILYLLTHPFSSHPTHTHKLPFIGFVESSYSITCASEGNRVSLIPERSHSTGRVPTVVLHC